MDGGGKAYGKAQRKAVPRSSHGEWTLRSSAIDPVEVITSQNADRIRWLVPIRHWRMSQSPFAFYRGGAKLMALDLSTTPSTGIYAQICGDAHLSNFGVYGSPERDLVFDLNDFDETLPGPWEWDVKRLVASFTIAARHNQLSTDHQARLPAIVAQAYRSSIRDLADMNYLDVWYSHLDLEEIFEAFSDQLSKKQRKKSTKFVTKARSKDSLHAQKKLAKEVDGSYRIVSQPPLLVPWREVPEAAGVELTEEQLRDVFEEYLESVRDHIAVLLRRFSFRDLAVKVVGVGSVGTRCFILLLEGRDEREPFFLQIKEAGPSVLEEHLPPSRYANSGKRVVQGQRLMQAASDSFLGWTHSPVSGHHYYWRQLKDMKGSLEVEKTSRKGLERYARLCGYTLARAHARSGDAIAIAAYLGKGSVFDDAMSSFAVAYADQNERDFAAFKAAIASGAIEARAAT